MLSRKGPGSRVTQGRRWVGTVEGDRGNKALDMDTARLLKTQDMGYIRTMRQVVRKEVARLEEQVVLTRELNGLEDEEDVVEDDEDDDDMPMPLRAKPNTPKKIIFFDDEEERQAGMQKGQEREDDKGEFEGFDDDEKSDVEESEGAKSLRRLKRDLEHARKKLKALTNAERELDIQRTKMAKTQTSGGVTRKGKKIMVRTRKR